MSAALERVIAEQQKEIDGLKLAVGSYRKHDLAKQVTDTEMFQKIDKVLGFKLRDNWKDDRADELKKYGLLLHSLRMQLLHNGWCIRCGEWCHSCGCNDE